jgi:ATP-dependent DNA helicase RecG
MYYSKDIESFGTGLKRITMACETAGVRIEFQLLKRGFAVVFYRSDAQQEPEADNAQTKAQSKRNNCALIENDVLNYFNIYPTATQVEVAKTIGKSRRTIQDVIAGLKERGLLERQGSKQNSRWVVKHNA